MIKRNVDIIVGGQYGSEGKGAVVQHLANEYDVHIRVGGPNAGHTIHHKGKKYAMQVIPCGWINPNARLFIGRGMVLDVDRFVNELEIIKEVDPNITKRIYIDNCCGILNKSHHEYEGGKDGWFNKKIGSTGEGVGRARVLRTERNDEVFSLAKDANLPGDVKEMLTPDTPSLLNALNNNNKRILIEGTQGSGLSLIHGPWPYCTSCDTNAAGFLSEVGLSPMVVRNVIMVCRTFPIRVAGNSGPLSNEITWDQLSNTLGKKVTEKTTVTKKIRRVGLFDFNEVIKAAEINRPNMIALMFADYMDPKNENVTEISKLSPNMRRMIMDIEHFTKTSVSFIGTGVTEEGVTIIDNRHS